MHIFLSFLGRGTHGVSRATHRHLFSLSFLQSLEWNSGCQAFQQVIYIPAVSEALDLKVIAERHRDRTTSVYSIRLFYLMRRAGRLTITSRFSRFGLWRATPDLRPLVPGHGWFSLSVWQNQLGRESPLRDCPDQVGLHVCLWGITGIIFIDAGRASLRLGGTVPCLGSCTVLKRRQQAEQPVGVHSLFSFCSWMGAVSCSKCLLGGGGRAGSGVPGSWVGSGPLCVLQMCSIYC